MQKSLMTIKTIIVSKENFKRKRELVEELSGAAAMGVKAGSLKTQSITQPITLSIT